MVAIRFTSSSRVVNSGSAGLAALQRQRFQSAPSTETGSAGASGQFSGDEIDDLRVSFELYGKVIPEIIGNGKTRVRTLYARDIERVVRTYSSGGKGGGGSSSTEIEYVATRILQISRKRPGSKIVRIAMNKDVVYDATSASNPTQLPGLVFRYHPGGPAETVDPILLEDKAADRVLAYKHLATVAIDKLPLSAFGGAWPYLIEVWIVDNDTQTTTREVITHISGTPDTQSVFDWASGRYWQIDLAGLGGVVMEFSVADNTQTTEIDIDITALDGLVGTFDAHDGHMAYMPSVRRIFGAENAGSTPNGGIGWLLDPESGIVVDADFLTSVPGSYIELYEDIIVYNEFGSTEAYLFGAYRVSTQLSIFSITETNLSRVYDDDPGASVLAMAAGPQFLGSSVCYVCFGTSVHQFEIKSGTTAENSASFITSSVVYTASASISNAWYDPADGGLILWLSTDDVLKISVSDFSTVLWTSTHPGTIHTPMDQFRIINRIGFASSSGTDNIFTMDTTSGVYSSVDVTLSPTDIGVWDDFTSSFFQWATAVTSRSQIGGILGQQSFLRDVLTTFMLSKGYAASTFDFTGIPLAEPYKVDNLKLIEDSSVDAVLFSVRAMFGLQLLELDKIYLVPIPADGDLVSTATITHHWLVDDGQGDPAAKFADEDDVEAPRRVEVSFLDDAQGDEFNTITPALSQFPVSTSQTIGDGTARLKAPVGITVDQATTLGYRFLNRRRVERKTVSVNFGPVNWAVQPADPVTVEVNGVSRVVRAGRQTLDPATLRLETDLHVMQQQATGDVTGAVGIGRPATVRSSATSDIFPLNAPLFRATLDQGGNALLIYVVMTGYATVNFTGATALMSQDGGASWDSVGRVEGAATYGRVIIPPAAPLTPFSTDYINTLTVRVVTGDENDLTSVTYEQALAGANSILIGADGRWEVMKVETWVDNGDGTFTGSGLHRSHLGSEFDTGSHVAGDAFFVIKESYLTPVILPLSALNNTILFRAIAHGSTFETSREVALSITGRAEKPNAPVQPEAVINSTDIDISWVRQTRGDGTWLDTTDNNALLEQAELYEIDILDGPGGAVVATYGADGTITTNSYKYLNTDLVADLGLTPATGETFTYVVYQISAVVGRGFGREATITL